MVNGESNYCEKCYQNLISENYRLQLSIVQLKREIDLLKLKKGYTEMDGEHIPQIN